MQWEVGGRIREEGGCQIKRVAQSRTRLKRLSSSSSSTSLYRGFPGGSEVKASACNVGDPSSILGLGRSPGEGNGNPLQYSCLENSMDERSLAGYSPWGRKESDMTERLQFHIGLYFYLPLCASWGQKTLSYSFL